jgi:murein DD-endopeptidase MepM/ murein hydrolase activator NlpD
MAPDPAADPAPPIEAMSGDGDGDGDDADPTAPASGGGLAQIAPERADAPPTVMPEVTRVPGVLVASTQGFAFDGGSVELRLMRQGDRVMQYAVNHYAVPIVIHWKMSALQNLGILGAADGVVLLPPAPAPAGDAPPVLLRGMEVQDPTARFHRDITFTARFGDPRARPARYAYRLPYPAGKSFPVLQGFHGAFSHRGSDEYAVDFDCPVATAVRAARGGLVVATHASAQGAGTTADYLDYKRVNFVIVLHDDGTLGEYMHLAPAGVEVMPGQRVERGQEIALSGNTGFSTTPHLHFEVMTAATDGVMAHSFPFEFAVTDDGNAAPVQGQRYPSWEQ